MSTRSLTLVFDQNGQQILNMYRHCDGYPSGHGAELAKFLGRFIVGNGISSQPLPFANGMRCLAAQIVAHFKDEPGQIYIYKTDQRNVWEEYIYEVRQSGDRVRMVCRYPEGRILFDGLASEFDADRVETMERES